MFWCVLTAGLAVLAGAVSAQERRASHCIALAEAAPGIEYLHQASWQDPLPDSASVRIHYIDHASFLIQTAGGLNVVTDFTGFLGTAPLIPDVVTMNHAHGTHWTEFPDPAIPHVLRGWGAFGEGIDHHLDLDEMLIRNVSTDIRSGSGVEPNGNSIFVFEVAGLCIGHLGHLHHVPTPAQFAALGRLDVVMAAVDGGTTLPLPDMLEVLGRLRSSVVIPMHWFGEVTLERFLSRIGESYAIERVKGPELVVSLRSLPDRPTVYVLRPAFLAAAP
ncbi:MBL fold metallo-hydrolase [Epibacterium sp. MM17-32]|uniref:MBL fold metallo-hydrolase n=1 Tax=Epibacterium sp. MM17-32 TaxID=2917734 RepID=UPI001EF54121|nr:MBL fold metallo-hydrolase [Epibacterium sp. MM17-32]MCG7627998.1 MBL fold metallo-hydrolase [Epibacterium sp. MM17-32]